MGLYNATRVVYLLGHLFFDIFILLQCVDGYFDPRAALRFCHEGRIYTVTMGQCPGGVLLKPFFKKLPDCFCANGIFMHKGSTAEGTYEGIVASRGMKCMEYKSKSYSEWNLFLSLTHPAATLNDTITIIPYQHGTNRLDYFGLRRYTVDNLLQQKDEPLREEIGREKIFYISHDRKTRRQEIQMGDLCLNKTIGFFDGVYIDDLIPEEEASSKSKWRSFATGDKCEDSTTKFRVSRRQNIHHYASYVKRQCQLPPNCIHDPATSLMMPDFSEEVLEDDSDLQRMSREAKCDKIVEENVQLAEYFTRLLHDQVLGYEFLENSGPFRIVEASLGVFKSVISDSVVSHTFLDQVFKYFYYIYFNRMGTRQKEQKEYTEKLIYTLHHCQLNSREMHFVTQGCPAEVEFYKKAKNMFENEFVGVELPQENRFDESRYDIIPEAVFKAVNFAYNYCVTYFDKRSKQRRHFRKEMKMLFTMGSLQNRWMKKCDTMNKVMQYKSILPYGDLNIIMKNLDAAVAAVMLDVTEGTDYIKRPVMKEEPASRKKRSILDYEAYEIWNGAAYCLQMMDYPKSSGPESWGIFPDITRIISP